MSLSLDILPTAEKGIRGKIHLKGFFMFLLRLADVCLENIAAHKFNLILLCVPCAACPAPVQSTGETVFSEVFFLNHLYNHTLNFNAPIIYYS